MKAFPPLAHLPLWLVFPRLGVGGSQMWTPPTLSTRIGTAPEMLMHSMM